MRCAGCRLDAGAGPGTALAPPGDRHPHRAVCRPSMSMSRPWVEGRVAGRTLLTSAQISVELNYARERLAAADLLVVYGATSADALMRASGYWSTSEISLIRRLAARSIACRPRLSSARAALPQA